MKKVFKVIAWGIAGVVILLALGIGVLTLTEYRPKATETVSVTGNAARAPKAGDHLSAVSFNIGYCGLPAEADFFMDGGKMSRVGSKDVIERNLEGVIAALKNADADLTLLQEVDRDSRRSYRMDEVSPLAASLGGQSMFASNFLCPFVPIPLTDPIGKVDSGIMTLSNLMVSEAARLSLPSPFSWPISTCNLKRCLLAARIPVEGGKELVVVNLHLEAFDDGAGKAAQTKVLADFLTEEYARGNYVVAGGDFNQWLPGVDQAKYPIRIAGAYIPGNMERTILPEGWTFAADDSTPTCRSGDKPYNAQNPENHFYVIDGFILSPNVKLSSVSTLPLGFQFSDHNPVRIEFELM